MSKTIPFKHQHLTSLLDQKINESIRPWAKGQLAKKMEESDSVTFIHKGKIMVCGGVTEYWEKRGHLWSIFSEESKYHFVPTFWAIKTWLTQMLETKYERIEMSMACNFLQAHRRAKLLGFELEVLRAKKYLFGEDCSIYSLVRGENSCM